MHMDDLSRLQLEDEKRKKRTEEEIRDPGEITGPDLCRMSAQERSPILSSRLCGVNVPDILLKSSFPYAHIQLEQFAMNALGSPEAVVCCHLPYPNDRLRGKPPPSSNRLSCAPGENTPRLPAGGAETLYSL